MITKLSDDSRFTLDYRDRLVKSVMFLAIGALFVELDRERGIGWQRRAQKMQLVAVNVAFIGTLLPTATAIPSLAWGLNWISLVAHFRDLEETSGTAGVTAAGRHVAPACEDTGDALGASGRLR